MIETTAIPLTSAWSWGGGGWQVRDALGLTYDVSFELSMFERLEVGWYVLSVTATPSKIDDALGASLRTLRGLATQQVSSSPPFSRSPLPYSAALHTALAHDERLPSRNRPRSGSCPRLSKPATRIVSDAEGDWGAGRSPSR